MAQTMDEILSSLSFDDREFKIENNLSVFSNVFNNSFLLKKSDNMCCDFIVVNLNSNNTDYKIFAIIESDSFLGADKDMGIIVRSVFLSDSKTGKIFIIEYQLGGIIMTKISNSVFKASASFNKGISRFAELDKHLIPKTTLVFDYLESGSIYSHIIYSRQNNKWYKTTNVLNKNLYLTDFDFESFIKLLNVNVSDIAPELCTPIDNFSVFQFVIP